MKLTKFTRAFCATLLLSAAPAFAGDFVAEGAYLRSSTATATSGAAFMMLVNQTGEDDRLVAASSDVAEKVELHTHTSDANGVMRMGEIEGGVAIDDEATHEFKRGGDHLMFLGLNRPLAQGEMVKVTLTFEKAGEVQIEVPVDLERKPDHGAMDHSTMDHSNMKHSD